MERLWPMLCLLFVATALMAGCGDQGLLTVHDGSGEDSESHAHHDEWETISFDSESDLSDSLSDGRAEFAPTQGAFRQVGMMIDGELGDDPEYRVQSDDGTWSPWTSLDVTWSEEERHVARIFLDGEASELEVRNFDGVSRLHLEFYGDIHGDPEVLTRDLPLEDEAATSEDGDVRTARQGLTPPAMVVSRHAWGARNPGKVCGRGHNAYRMSIHHTASPSNDGGDPARRMRQMQAFHIDSRGWCDIGYHFVVSQSGQVLQGRSSSGRTGAHVGGQNYGNIGISLIGNFNAQVPKARQLNATAEIMRWVSEAHGVALNRSRVKGHREWPGQGTSCPGGHLLARIPHLLQLATSGATGGTTQPAAGPIAPPAAPARCGTLKPGEGLVPGRAVDSCDGRFQLIQQHDGNLVLYQRGVGALWATGTNGQGHTLVMQGDGNLVQYTAHSQPSWSSNTHGTQGARLAIQDDGNLVVYDGAGRPQWSSNTRGVWLPPAPANCGEMRPGEGLVPGRALGSCDRRFSLVLQHDGNLVLYQAGVGPLWATGTTRGHHLVMQGDGNLVLYTRDHRPIWDTRTHGASGAILAVQGDGNVVIYGASGALWSTRTGGR